MIGAVAEPYTSDGYAGGYGGWTNGDFDYGGGVNQTDYNIFGDTLMTLGAVVGASIQAHANGDSSTASVDATGTSPSIIITANDITGARVSLGSQTVNVTVSKNTPLPPGASITIQSQSVNPDGTITLVLATSGLTAGASYTVLFNVNAPGSGTIYTAGSLTLNAH
jgi:hypothetical protein